MPWLTLSGSNCPWLEQFSMVPKMFESLKFDCIHVWSQRCSSHLGFTVASRPVVILLNAARRFFSFAVSACNYQTASFVVYMMSLLFIHVCWFFFSGPSMEWLHSLIVHFPGLFQFHLLFAGGGRVVRRCCVSYITGASNWYWLTVGQGLLSL